MNVLRNVRILALAAVTSLAACDSGTAFEDGGTLEGAVTVTGSTEVGTDPHVMLYGSPADLVSRRNGARVPLNGSGSSFDFRVRNMTPGTYYIAACFASGCEPHQTGSEGPDPVVIRTGETTTVSIQV